MDAKKDPRPALPPGTVHALRTPLGALVCALDVADLPGVDAATHQEAMAVARRQAHRLGLLIDALDRSAT